MKMKLGQIEKFYCYVYLYDNVFFNKLSAAPTHCNKCMGIKKYIYE